MSELSARERDVLGRHFGCAPAGEALTRVRQTDDTSSVFNPRTGRLHVHKHDRRKSAKQELVFESVGSVCSTLSAGHTVKLWDLRRRLSARELARLQGFPEAFELPRSRATELFGNAVAVPVAAHACACAWDGPPGVRFLDVCAGIGGFHAAMAAVDPAAVCVGFSEVKPAAVATYDRNYPGVPNLGDATVAAWPPADVVLAGFPCQPFSRSQQARAPHEHAAFGFFEHVLRALDESGASSVVLENVGALRSTGREVLERLLAGLARRGFATDHAVLDAKEFGLPQTRKRLFLVGRVGRAPAPLVRTVAGERVTLGQILETTDAERTADGGRAPLPAGGAA